MQGEWGAVGYPRLIRDVDYPSRSFAVGGDSSGFEHEEYDDEEQ